MFTPLAQFDIKVIKVMTMLNKLDISITNINLTLILVLFLSIYIFFLLKKTYKLIPTSWQILMEKLFLFIYNMVEMQIGKKGLKYFPYIITLFMYILILNLYGLTPYSFAVTSHFIWTIYFSISICLGIFLIGLLNYKLKFLKLFLPKVPLVLVPLMLIIEIASYIIRSFSLAIRLSANIMAGHTLSHIIADVIVFLFSFSNILELFSWLVVLLLTGIMILEMGVSCLQAYVFVLLICMYLNDSVNFEEH